MATHPRIINRSIVVAHVNSPHDPSTNRTVPGKQQRFTWTHQAKTHTHDDDDDDDDNTFTADTDSEKTAHRDTDDPKDDDQDHNKTEEAASSGQHSKTGSQQGTAPTLPDIYQ